MNFFKSKLRKRIESEIMDMESTISGLRDEIAEKRIKQTLNPMQHAHYIVMIGNVTEKVNLLKSLL